MSGSRGGTGGLVTFVQNHKNMGFNTGPDPLKYHKATKKRNNLNIFVSKLIEKDVKNIVIHANICGMQHTHRQSDAQTVPFNLFCKTTTMVLWRLVNFANGK